jgi:EAL domain-containing protein (putative c-di-GMP-specific phosphodiesterase class I)
VVAPGIFIPLTEEDGLIVTMGEWILRAACREAASWPNKLQISVNLSPVQFRNDDIVRLVHEALIETGLDAARLQLEITEGVLIDDFSRAVSILRRLKSLGVRIALDDFGTGYSSLSYLGRLPIDKIKIDQSFVKRLPGDQQAGVIIRAVMMLSEALDKTVIAEGIETADQAWMLKMMGCKVGQGYHFGRPKTATEMRAFLLDREEASRRAQV